MMSSRLVIKFKKTKNAFVILQNPDIKPRLSF